MSAQPKYIPAAPPPPAQKHTGKIEEFMLPNYQPSYALRGRFVTVNSAVLGEMMEREPITFTAQIDTIQQYSGSRCAIRGVDLATLRNRVWYVFFDGTITDPVITPSNKDMAALAPKVLPLRAARYHSTIGADPELFALRTDGSLFPSFEFLGEKHDYDTDPLGPAADHTAAYWDGYQAEFAFLPDKCMDILVSRMWRGLKKVLDSARATDPGARLSVQTTMDIPMDRLRADREEYVQFGCNPSLNVYGDHPPKQEGKDVPFRSSGGHLHFSIPDGNENKHLPRIIKELDRILGVISVAMFQYYDTPVRRILYGRAGEYRAPKYGFEYRPLSSAWTMHPGITQFVFEMARHIIGATLKGGVDEPLSWWDVTEDEARLCINNCDVTAAQALIDRNRDSLVVLLLAMPRTDTCSLVEVNKLIDGPLKHGVHTAYRNPDQYSEAWALDKTAPSTMQREVRQWSRAFETFIHSGWFD